MIWEVRGILQRPITITIEAPSAAVALTLARTVRFNPPEEVQDIYEEAEIVIEDSFEIYAARADRRFDLEEDPEEEEEEGEWRMAWD
jgi:hypothetical protein